MWDAEKAESGPGILQSTCRAIERRHNRKGHDSPGYNRWGFFCAAWGHALRSIIITAKHGASADSFGIRALVARREHYDELVFGHEIDPE